MSKVFRNDLKIKDIPNQRKLRDVFFSLNMKLLLVIVPASLPPEPHSCDQHQQKSHSVFHQIHNLTLAQYLLQFHITLYLLH